MFRENLNYELSSLRRVAAVAERLLAKYTTTPFDDEGLFAATAVFQNCYNGIENIFKQCCKYHAVTLPTSENWHVTLMQWFCDTEPRTFATLPILVPPPLRGNMTKLRKFRHVIMHGYSFTLDTDLVYTALTDIPVLIHAFVQEVERYDKTLPLLPL
jgi:hypothetical protein